MQFALPKPGARASRERREFSGSRVAAKNVIGCVLRLGSRHNHKPSIIAKLL